MQGEPTRPGARPGGVQPPAQGQGVSSSARRRRRRRGHGGQGQSQAPAAQAAASRGQATAAREAEKPAPRAPQPSRRSAPQGQKNGDTPRGGRSAREAAPAPGKEPRSRAPRQAQAPRAPRRREAEEDPGLELISRRPPKQKFGSFEEYMAAHGGPTAPLPEEAAAPAENEKPFAMPGGPGGLL